MALHPKSNFQNWIDNHNIPETVKSYLFANGYDNVDLLHYLTPQRINQSNLIKSDKDLLINALRWNGDSDSNEYSDDDDDFDGFVREGSDEHDNPERGESDNRSNDLPLGNTNSTSADNEIRRWKEFGLARPFKKWNKYYYPVELFSPDGFWAWNSAAKSLLYGSQKVDDVWNMFDNNNPGWIMSPPVLLPVRNGPFKLSFNLRVFPKKADDAPKLQLQLFNDPYNRNLLKSVNLPLNFSVIFQFINVSNGTMAGEPIRCSICLRELHDSFEMDIPGNILALRKPPIISTQLI